jgi:hypothetical protein
LKQPQLYRKYAELKADAKLKLNKAHENVKVVRSELVLKAKRGGEELLGCKATDPVTEAYYRTHEKYKKAKEEMIQAEYEYNILEGAVWSFQQRKEALENEVKLWAGSYFAGPTEPRDTKKLNIKERANDALDKKATENLNKKRRKR